MGSKTEDGEDQASYVRHYTLSMPSRWSAKTSGVDRLKLGVGGRAATPSAVAGELVAKEGEQSTQSHDSSRPVEAAAAHSNGREKGRRIVVTRGRNNWYQDTAPRENTG
jgi:hypothetical protein